MSPRVEVLADVKPRLGEGPLAPDGRGERAIAMPVRKATSVAFGGPGLDVLRDLDGRAPLPRHPGDGPQRGAVFRVTGLGARGRPEPRFAG